jgi:hypothetical protein
MALFKQFSGEIFDKDGVPKTNVRFKGYHKPTNKWSTWYDSGTESQYNINLGDAAWLTQDGTSLSGDIILIVLETTEVNPIDRQFVMFETSVTSVGTQVQDVQLKEIQPPNVTGLWYLSSPTDGITTYNDPIVAGRKINIGRINEVITATSNFNNNFTWTFAGALMLHYETYQTQTIFADRLAIVTINYDWLDNLADDWAALNLHTYTAISNTTNPKYNEVRVKATNKKGLSTIDTLWLQLRYNAPVPNFDWTPNRPSIQDTFVVTNQAVDINSRIANIVYKLDGSVLFNNYDKAYSWMQMLGSTYQSTHTINTDILWNDGFTDNTIIYSETITMTNLAPTFTILNEVVGEVASNHNRFTLQDLLDPDGPSNQIAVKWTISYKTPFDNIYKVVYDPGYPAVIDLSFREWIFNIQGEYRVTATAKDIHGEESSRSVDLNFASGSQCQGTGSIRLNNNNWQLVAIPVRNKVISDYFIAKVTAAVQVYNPSKTAADVIEVASAYPGHVNKFLSYIPGFTSPTSEHNFSHMLADGSSVNEITAFWVKCKNYKLLTSNNDLVINWDQADA